jgi:hypothetical protein
MRSTFVPLAGALALGVLVHAGCAERRYEQARAERPATPVGTTAVVSRRRPPPAPRQGPPAVARDTLGETPPPSGPATNTAPPTTNIAPPAPGVTEEQAPPESAEERARATKVVAEASSQIDRLQRIQSMSTEAHRDDLDAAVYELQRKRERVLQDLRELDMQPPQQRARIGAELQGDLGDLGAALAVSYRFAPPPARGLPSPAPLPPSHVP